MFERSRRGCAVLLAMLVALAGWPGAGAAQCTVTVGVVMELTGPAGQFGQAGAKSVEMAFRDLNEAGGPGGCKLAAEIRDAQSQGAVAVDVAKQLVEIKRVPAKHNPGYRVGPRCGGGPPRQEQAPMRQGATRSTAVLFGDVRAGRAAARSFVPGLKFRLQSAEKAT